MSTAAELLVAPRDTVRTAYDCLDAILTTCGIRDLTDGMYADETTGYEAAQQAQRQWLLDEVGCQAGSRLLDVGCGYGTLLEDARQRGAETMGITLSPKQAAYCRKRGLLVLVCDYRCLPDGLRHNFDCLVANGSAEHFVQPDDAAAGRQDAIYQEFFRICRDLLNPSSSARRLATTIIHFDRVRPEPLDLLKPPGSWQRDSDEYHMAILESTLGGYLPAEGQLERCALSNFTLVKALDGTADYRRTSEDWLKIIRRSFRQPLRFGIIMSKLLPSIVISPRRVRLTLELLKTESWQWQFRGEHPPVKLWRQVWQCG